jgi:drug/metabolite transporter (DMT)-like permease
VQLPWYISALAAAVVWGIHYPLVGYALKRLSLASVLVLTALPIVLMMPFVTRSLARDITIVRAMPPREAAPLLALCVTSVVATILLFVSIGGKNATLASLIEISYPAFVAFFAWLLFREIHVTASVGVGAVLIFAGVSVIVWNNP